MATATVMVEQISSAASRGNVRGHELGRTIEQSGTDHHLNNLGQKITGSGISL